MAALKTMNPAWESRQTGPLSETFPPRGAFGEYTAAWLILAGCRTKARSGVCGCRVDFYLQCNCWFPE